MNNHNYSLTGTKPFKALGPGITIQEYLDDKGWRQEDLADILEVSNKHVNEIIRNKKPLTIELSKLLAKVFNTSAEYWMTLDTNFRLLKLEIPERENEVELKAWIYQHVPLKEMIKNGWLKDTHDINDLANQVKKILGVKSFDSKMEVHESDLRFRKSEKLSVNFIDSYAKAWHGIAMKYASHFRVPKYNKNTLSRLFDTINEYTIDEKNGIPNFLHELNQCGVKFIRISHLQKTYIDGAAFLQGDNPVIAYTARYDRLDNFWWTVAHELAHVLKHLNHTTNAFLDNLSIEPDTNIEKEADQIAGEKFFKKEIINYFENETKYVTSGRVKSFAEKYKLHPCIVDGILAHHDLLNWVYIHRFNHTAKDKIPDEYNVG